MEAKPSLEYLLRIGRSGGERSTTGSSSRQTWQRSWWPWSPTCQRGGHRDPSPAGQEELLMRSPARGLELHDRPRRTPYARIFVNRASVASNRSRSSLSNSNACPRFALRNGPKIFGRSQIKCRPPAEVNPSAIAEHTVWTTCAKLCPPHRQQAYAVVEVFAAVGVPGPGRPAHAPTPTA